MSRSPRAGNHRGVTWLFTISIALVFVGVAFTIRTAHIRDATIVRRGPVPGYSYTPGVHVDLAEFTNGADGTRWKIRSLEEFHSRDRTRVILSVEVTQEGVSSMRDALREVAKYLRARVSVDVVVVEAGKRRLLFSPDGAGWSGQGSHDELYLP